MNIVKCNSCLNENFSTSMHSIGEKFKKRTKYYGRLIYSCDKCYEKELERFKLDLHKDGVLIIRPPISNIQLKYLGNFTVEKMELE